MTFFDALEALRLSLYRLNTHPILWWVVAWNIPVLAVTLRHHKIPTVRLEAALCFTLAICTGIACASSIWAVATPDDNLTAAYGVTFAVGAAIGAVALGWHWHRLTKD